MGKDKEIQKVDTSSADETALVGKNESFDDEDSGDEWDLSASSDQEAPSGEMSQIEAFLNKRLMVRCERYNANLTSVGCQRKKESPPPKLKNTALSEEDNMQNHPCFACVGPVVINWDIEDSPIALHEVEKKQVIVHPNLEDDFTAARARQIALYKKMSKPGSRTQSPEELEKAAKSFIEIPPRILPGEEGEEGTTTSRNSGFRHSHNRNHSRRAIAPTPVVKKQEVKKEKKQEIKKEVSPAPKQNAAPTPKPEKKPVVIQAKKEVVVQEVSVEKKENSPKKKENSPKKKEASAEKKTARKPTKSTKSVKKHTDTCTSCKRSYAEPYIKNWRGDLCNPCYAKKLRERKKQQLQQTGEQKEEKITKVHPPCAMCEREYEEPYVKNWRGEICNPCYAKKLRARKKQQKG